MIKNKFIGYAVRGVKEINGKATFVFYCIDNSTGYPYWSDFKKDVSLDLGRVLEWLNESTAVDGYLSKTTTNTVIVKVYETQEIVKTPELQKSLREIALGKLNAAEKRALGLVL